MTETTLTKHPEAATPPPVRTIETNRRRKAKRSGAQWAAASIMFAVLVLGLLFALSAIDNVADAGALDRSRLEAVNERQDGALVDQAESVSDLSRDVVALREELQRQGVDPDTIAPDPQERINVPTLSGSTGMSTDEIVAYVTTYLSANRPQDGRTPTVEEVRAVVDTALTEACGDTCEGDRGADGNTGNTGGTGATGRDAAPPTSVTGAAISTDGRLLLTLSNGSDVTQVDAGALPVGEQGARGPAGQAGQPPVQWVVRRADGTTETCVRVQDFTPAQPEYTCSSEAVTVPPDAVQPDEGAGGGSSLPGLLGGS